MLFVGGVKYLLGGRMFFWLTAVVVAVWTTVFGALVGPDSDDLIR